MERGGDGRHNGRKEADVWVLGFGFGGVCSNLNFDLNYFDEMSLLTDNKFGICSNSNVLPAVCE